jgi:hypothetical protein
MKKAETCKSQKAVRTIGSSRLHMNLSSTAIHRTESKYQRKANSDKIKQALKVDEMRKKHDHQMYFVYLKQHCIEMAFAETYFKTS